MKTRSILRKTPTAPAIQDAYEEAHLLIPLPGEPKGLGLQELGIGHTPPMRAAAMRLSKMAGYRLSKSLCLLPDSSD